MNELTQCNKMMSLIQGFVTSEILIVAAKNDLYSHLTSSKYTVSKLAKKLKMDYASFKRICVALDALEIIALDGENITTTENTAFLNLINSPHICDGYAVVGVMDEALKSGKSAWEHIYGKDFYTYLSGDPEKRKQFNRWCDNTAKVWMLPIISNRLFTTSGKIVDVGGGHGYFLAELLKKNELANGVLFDQEIPVKEAQRIFPANLNKRIKFIAGDFFQDIPVGGDLYIICRTLLNWSEEEAILILKNIYKSMRRNSRLIVVDYLIPTKAHPNYTNAVLSDVFLLPTFGGCVYTEEKWRELITQAGFKVEQFEITAPSEEGGPTLPLFIGECRV